VLLQREQLRRRRRTLGEFGSSAGVCVTICFCLLLTRLVYKENQADSTLPVVAAVDDNHSLLLTLFIGQSTDVFDVMDSVRCMPASEL